MPKNVCWTKGRMLFYLAKEKVNTFHANSSGIGALGDYYLSIESHYSRIAQQSVNYSFSSMAINREL